MIPLKGATTRAYFSMDRCFERCLWSRQVCPWRWPHEFWRLRTLRPSMNVLCQPGMIHRVTRWTSTCPVRKFATARNSMSRRTDSTVEPRCGVNNVAGCSSRRDGNSLWASWIRQGFTFKDVRGVAYSCPSPSSHVFNPRMSTAAPHWVATSAEITFSFMVEDIDIIAVGVTHNQKAR